MQYTDKDNTAVCSLGNLILPSYVKNRIFDFDLLHKNAKILTTNINNIIDKSFYPCEKAERCSKN